MFTKSPTDTLNNLVNIFIYIHDDHMGETKNNIFIMVCIYII